MIRIIVALFLATLSSAAFAQGAAVNLNCSNSNTTGSQQWQQCPGNKNTTNHSVVIASGGTFQVALNAASNRSSLTIENNNVTDACYLYIGSGSATEGTAILLQGNGGSYTRYFPFVPADEIQVTCANTSDTMYLDTQ